MGLLDAARTRARGIFRRGRIERELEAELTFHFEQQVAENLAAGMRPEQARRAARQAVGRPDSIKDDFRDLHRLPVVETAWRDIRYAARSLRRAPLYSVVALVTLALGIGANILIFSVLDAVALRPLPYPDADELMILQIELTFPGRGTNTAPWSYPKFEDLRSDATAFDAIEGFVPREVNMSGAGEPGRVKAEIVTGGYFSMLGVPALVGRTIGVEDDRKHEPRPVAVLSEGLWRRMFAADPAIVGRSIHVNREPVTIVGVVAANFHGESGSADLWVPVVALAPPLMNNPARLRMRMAHWLNVVARRRPGVTAAQADADVRAVVRRMEEAQPSTAFPRPGVAGPVWGGSATALADAKVDPLIRQSLGILLAAVGFVLLITCINLASLMLSRALTRQREIAVRLAIGASRIALVRHALTESTLLGLAGGLLGVLVAAAGTKGLALLKPDGQLGPTAPFVRRLTTDWTDLQSPATVAFALSVALVAGILFGVLPALQTTRLDLAHVMKTGEGGWKRTGRRRRLNVRRALLVVQVALAIVLLVGAGLTLRSFSRVLDVPLGFDAGRVLTLRLDPPRAHYDDDARMVLFERVAARLRALPGVEAAAVASGLPLRGQNENTSFRVDGSDVLGEIGVHMVGHEYFGALGIPLIKGRLLTESDSAAAPRVAVVNETLARRLWPGGDPIGRRLLLGLTGWDERGRDATIVGVVGDVKYQLVDMPVGFDVYLSYPQRPPVVTSFVVRTSGNPLSIANAARQQVASVDGSLPAHEVIPLARIARDATGRWRFVGVLLAAFAGLATILTAAGIYGLLACSVVARTKEIGVRVALGAERTEVVRLVLLDACAICAVGLGIGLPVAAALAGFMRGQLYGIEPIDPPTLFAVAGLVAVTGLLAAMLPAQRASRVDPLIALRHE